MERRERPQRDTYLPGGRAPQRPAPFRQGMGIPPGPGWEWYVIDMLDHICSLLEGREESSEPHA